MVEVRGTDAWWAMGGILECRNKEEEFKKELENRDKMRRRINIKEGLICWSRICEAGSVWLSGK